MNTNERRRIGDGEAGQATIVVILMLGIFLLAVFAFAVDLTNMWFHRQSTQTAADAACQAGAMDLLTIASGTTPASMGFTAGTAGNCASSSSASMCKYAGFNGYSGTGFSSSSASNSVSWTFPGTVTGATPPSSSVAPYPFVKVVVEENVKTWFMAMLGFKYQAVAASCTCGLTEVLSASPIVVLAPTGSSLTYTGGGTVQVFGGPQRSIQVNSTSSTAVVCSPSGLLNTSSAGPNSTGGDIGVTGGPIALPATCYGSGYGNTGYYGGTTGIWRSPVPPTPDPYAGVPAPTAPATSTTATTAHVVSYGQDGCPDHSPTNYVSTVPHSGCIEYEPGYYPSAINLSANDVVIMKPGIYYMNGSFSIGGSDDIRLATPCTPTCSLWSSTAWSQTNGVMFYFLSGSLQISGATGGLASSRVDPVNSTSLTCNGTAPTAAVGVPATNNGNVLVAQCSTNGTYVGPPSVDTTSSSGSRGLLVYMAHSNSTSVGLAGSGSLAFSGSIYSHNSSFSDIFDVSGAAGSNTFILGEIVSDNISVTGSGTIKMALNPGASVDLIKVSILQ